MSDPTSRPRGWLGRLWRLRRPRPRTQLSWECVIVVDGEVPLQDVRACVREFQSSLRNFTPG